MQGIPNFTREVESPFKRAMEAFEGGAKLRQQEQLFNQQQEQNRLKSQLIQQEQAKARATQSDIFAYSQIENPTAEDTANLMARQPHIASSIKQSFDVFTTGQKDVKLKQLSEVYSSLASGAPDVAIKLLEKRKEAATNSGLEEQANEAEALIKIIEADPNAGLTSARITLSALDPKRLKDINEAIGVVTDVEQNKLDMDQLALDLDATKTVADGEDKVRGEFAKVKAINDQTLVSSGKVKSSFSQNTAAGDLAGIIAFMKMIDPGSTVREGEVLTVKKAGGIDDKTITLYKQLFKGESLSADQRKDFMTTADNLIKADNASFNSNVNRLKVLSKNRGYNDENIFGAGTIEEVEEEVTPVGTETVPTATGRKFEGFTLKN